MNKSPFYSIRLKDTQEDISDNITRLRFEESVSKDDLLRLSVTSKKAVELLQQGFLAIGQELIFTYGYIGGAQSGARLARVTGRDRGYGQQINYNVIATDLGLLMKKAQRFDDWSGSTSSEIVRRIAQRNGFQTEIQNTKDVHQIMPQGGKTDFQLLKELANIEGEGYRFFVRGDTMHFTKRNLLSPSVVTYSYNNKRSWLSLKVQERDNTKDGGSKSTEVRNINPLTGEGATGKSEAQTALEGALGKITVHVNGRGEEQFVSPSVSAKASKTESVNRVIVGGSHHKLNDARKESDSYQRKAALSDISAAFSTIGNPLAASDTVITLEGIPDEDAGNWYVDTVVHELDAGTSYVTNMELQRNGSNLRSTQGGNIEKPRSKVNETTGASDGENKEEMVIVDGNGNIIG